MIGLRDFQTGRSFLDECITTARFVHDRLIASLSLT
jgi:hypothetical protein